MLLVSSHIQLRRDISQEWTKKNIILRVGEPGYETDTGKLKIGDGITKWKNLNYISNISFNIIDDIMNQIKYLSEKTEYLTTLIDNLSSGGTDQSNIRGIDGGYFTDKIFLRTFKCRTFTEISYSRYANGGYFTDGLGNRVIHGGYF